MWGDDDAGELWTEYGTATAGQRAIVGSRGLMERYGVRQADDDEAAVEEVVERLAVVELDPIMWLVLAPSTSNGTTSRLSSSGQRTGVGEARR